MHRGIISISLLLTHLICSAQRTIPIDSLSLQEYKPNTVLDKPNLDSIRLELRFWNGGYIMGQTFLQMTVDNNDKWRYRIGYISSDSAKVKVTEENKNSIDWLELWTKLDSLKIDSIPDQYDINLFYKKNGKTYSVDSRMYFEQIMDGDYYYIEWFSGEGYRSIGYDNPSSYLKSLLGHNLTGVEEHKRFIAAIDLINQSFNIKGALIMQMEERRAYYYTDKKKKKRK